MNFPHDPPGPSLEARLHRLERENRTIKMVAGTVLLGVLSTAVAVCQPASTAPVVEAERFIVRDANGNKRAELAPSRSGAVLALYTREGKREVTLFTADQYDGPRLMLTQGAHVLTANGQSLTISGPRDIIRIEVGEDGAQIVSRGAAGERNWPAP